MSNSAATSPRTDYEHITVTPLTLHIGAEISGVDLNSPFPDDVLADIRAAFIDWKVVFFRAQHLDHAAHVAFARRFGAPTIGHVVFGHDDEFPEIYSVAKRRTANSIQPVAPAKPWSGWHTDITAAVNPPMASILRGVTIPPYGGDTFWTNLAAAYRGLSEPLREFVDTLDGRHRFDVPDSGKKAVDYVERVESSRLESIHPLVTVHPETGEHLLYVSPDFLHSIEGLSPRESQQLLELLWEQIVRPEYAVRYKWQPGDVAMWDNRSTAHLAPSDIFDSDFDRQLYRVTLVGEPQVGTDGRTSHAVSGTPILSAVEQLNSSE